MNKLRYKILYKLSQTADNLTTDGVNATKTVSGSPTPFIATDYYPNIILAFSSNNATIINKLIDVINMALYYTSNGKVDFQWMKSNNFNFTTSDIPSVDLKNLMNFSKEIYSQIFSSNRQKLNPEEISQKINLLKNSKALQNISSTNPVGQLSGKIGGNIKVVINNYLLQIK